MTHVREDGLVPVLINRKHEVVQEGVDWYDTQFREHAIGVLRAGGQLLRVPRHVARQLRMWDRVEILQLGVTQADQQPTQISIPRVGENAGSPHD